MEQVRVTEAAQHPVAEQEGSNCGQAGQAEPAGAVPGRNMQSEPSKAGENYEGLVDPVSKQPASAAAKGEILCNDHLSKMKRFSELDGYHLHCQCFAWPTGRS